MHRYLGTDPASEIARVRAREPDWFALADEVASYAGELIFRLKVRRGNELLLLSAVLYRRIAGSFEAVIALAERGLHTEGLATRRSLLEALFVLGAIHKNPALVQAHLLMDMHRRRDIFKNIKKLSSKLKNALPPELSQENVDKTVAELECAAKGIPYFGPEQYAQAAGLHDTYLTDYSFLSEAAHHVAKDIERNISVDNDGDVDGLYWGPGRDPPSALLFPAIEHALIAVDTTEKMFKLKSSSSFKKLRKQAQQMFKHAASVK